jgi:hypothetical protein
MQVAAVTSVAADPAGARAQLAEVFHRAQAAGLQVTRTPSHLFVDHEGLLHGQV